MPNKRRKDGYIQRQVTIDGVSKRFYGKTERELNQKIAAWKLEKKSGPTFQAVAEQWKEEHFEKLRNGTVMCYTPAFKRSVEEFGDKRINEVTPNDISLLINDLINKSYSGKTVKTQKTVLGMIFNYAIIHGLIYISPVAAIKLPKNMPKKKRVLPSDESVELVKNCTDIPFCEYPYFLVYSGCRRGEGLAMTWGDIDFKNKEITVNKQLLFKNNRPEIQNYTKTEAGSRSIILLDPLRDFLKKMKPKKAKKTDMLFLDEGELYTEKVFRNRWNQYCRTLNIDVTPHQLRHGFATMLYEAGIDIKTAQALLGHADVSVTMDIYTHIRQSRMAEAAKTLNKFVSKK